jgi:hypothetical protein
MTDTEAFAQAQRIWGDRANALRNRHGHYVVGPIGPLMAYEVHNYDLPGWMRGGTGMSWEEAFDEAYERENEKWEQPITFDVIEEFRRSLAAMVDSGTMPVLPLPAPRDQVDCAEYSRRQNQLDARWSRLVCRYRFKHSGGAWYPKMDFGTKPSAGFVPLFVNRDGLPTMMQFDDISEIPTRREQERLHRMIEADLIRFPTPAEEAPIVTAMAETIREDIDSEIVAEVNHKIDHMTDEDVRRSNPLVGDERRPKGSE